MLAKIGALVKAERARQQLGVADLGVHPDVLTSLEDGRPGITSIQLDAIAEALQVDAVSLHRGEIVPRPVPSIFLRHHALQDFDNADGGALDDALEQARARNVLCALTEQDPGLYPQGRFRERAVAADQTNAPAYQGYQLAREVRQVVGNEANALGDIAEFAEVTLGVTVVVQQLRTLGSTAVSVKAGDAATVVLTPSVATRDGLTRVLIAHELCHVLFDPSNGALNIVVDFEADRRTHQAEQRARAFAAELLVPDAGVRKRFGAPRAVNGENAALKLVAEVRDQFGASWQATANHLCNLNYVDLALRDWLERSPPLAASRAWMTRLPEEARRSKRLEALARLAHERGRITDGEARDVLGLDTLVPLPWVRG